MSIKAITFDVFGTLLEFRKGCPWLKGYVAEVDAVARGEKPYRPLSAIFGEIGADMADLHTRPGVGDALRQLGRRYRTAPLSNADSRLTSDLASWFGLEWSQHGGTEAAGAFKPDPRVYCLGLRQLGLDGPEVLHVAAHDYDLAGAAKLGYRTAYLEWPGYAQLSDGVFDYRAASLSELAAQLTNPPESHQSETR